MNLKDKLTIWETINISRNPNRPKSLDYINLLFKNFEELHGDRKFSDDESIIAGIAFFENLPIAIIAQQKGSSLKENIQRNFGSPYPEGYRKALRIMKLAEKFNIPIISFIDTPGAYPGISSEERHISESIAVNIQTMSSLKTPIISFIIGEGGSGGALGIAVSDVTIMLENAYYSVISPEGCASILWKDKKYAPKAAELLKISSYELLENKIIDHIIKEPKDGAENNIEFIITQIREYLYNQIKILKKESIENLLNNRYIKYRKIGKFIIKNES